MIKTEYQFYAVRDPIGKIKPPILKQDLGVKATFECESAGDAKWFFEKKTLPRNVFERYDSRTNSRFISIRQIHTTNAGNYYCFFGREFLAQAELIPIGLFSKNISY